MFKIQFLVDLATNVLNFLYSVVGNYGVAIIIITIIVKSLLYPLMVKQEKSMYKMKLIQPKINELNKKYANDKTTLGQKTQELYKEEGVNPLGGCLPLLIQLPIFVALYYTFTEAIPKNSMFLWFDLTKPDALFSIKDFNLNLLPILSGAVMFIQQKIQMGSKDDNASAAENSMSSAMTFMPVLMTFLFYNFPSGVSLYYLLNSAISILQQMYIRSRMNKEYEGK